MADHSSINRRGMLKATGMAGVGMAGVGMAWLSAQARAAESRRKSPLKFNHDDFYTADGKFDMKAAEDAYIKLMKYHRYPIFEGLRERLWISDYGVGEFTKVGLGAICFLNDEESGYLGQDIYLLPGQMLPEHYHLKTDKAPPKMEGWHVRHGVSYVYGEGQPPERMKAAIPESQQKYVTVMHETILKPGQSCKLNRPTAHHWQFAGPQGAIISEYGTFHDNDGVRHHNPKLVFP